jgi:hypothetical protein
MMNILEPFLASGNIHISARSGLLFKAQFIPTDGDTVTRQSDRGFDHLWMLLAAAISRNTKIKDEADKKFQYSLTFANSCPTERRCRHAYIEMRKGANGFFEVKITKIESDPSPGIYCRHAMKPGLDEAFESALLRTPIRV